MAWGIRVRNDLFTTQIDQDFKNYGFIQIIPVTVSVTYPTISEQGLVKVTVPGQNAMVGVRCQTLFYTSLGSSFDGVNWLFTFKFMPEFAFTGTITETVYLYVFNSLPAGGLSSFGIRIRNPVTGETVFHSDMRPLYMEAQSPCTAGFGGSGTKVYCPIITRLCFINNFLGGTMGYRFQPYGLRCTASGIEVKQFTLGGAGEVYAAFFEWYDAGEYAVVDVTGLS